MAEAPKRKAAAAKTVSVEPKRPVRRKEPEYRIGLEIGDTVEHDGMCATVTGVSKKSGTVYLDSPVCRWVPAAECAKE